MKLRKLILHGFKSFADRTEFEFDDGISCVVGPNGCGKSNIVDAFKWVLGEQSAKSLRGSEMMDVIFNGSASRRASPSATVTLVFDNTDGSLQPPGITGEFPATVTITRRLFRDGQSEYRINKAAARLKDIREMFMDTGLGRDAYGLIEQGKVEAFLQASHDDRRAIFDEAAGISKYKARKKEASRKLDRVEQDLLRVTDVLGEVEKRLRSIKYQAGKARNYQTYSESLKELKSLHFLARYHTLTNQRTTIESQLDKATDILAGITSKVSQLEASASGTEVELLDMTRAGQEIQSKIAGVGARITACEERAQLLTTRASELGERLVIISARCEEDEAKIETCSLEITTLTQEQSQTEEMIENISVGIEAVQAEKTAGELALAELEKKVADDKARALELMRSVAREHNEITALTVRQENLVNQKTRLSQRGTQISFALTEALDAGADAKTNRDKASEEVATYTNELESASQVSAKLAQSEQELQRDLASVREDRSSVLSRTNALSEMQNRLEGVGQGVKRLLKSVADGKIASIRGMLGDFIETDVDHAAVVEAALAGRDQLLLAERLSAVTQESDQLRESLASGGSAEIMCLDQIRQDQEQSAGSYENNPDIIARVLDWVTCESRLRPAVNQLLATTVVVADLAAGQRIRTSLPMARIVTLDGEVLEPDGRLRIGTSNRSTGTIARRSELTQLESKLKTLDTSIENLSSKRDSTRSKMQWIDDQQKQLRQKLFETNTKRVEFASKVDQFTSQAEKLESEKPLLEADIERIEEEIAQALTKQTKAKENVQALETQANQASQRISEQTSSIAKGRGELDILVAKMTELKVSIASAQQKRAGTRGAIAGLQRQKTQLTDDLATGRETITLFRQRKGESEQGISSTRQEIETIYAEQEKLNIDSSDNEQSRQSLSDKLNSIRREMSTQRKSSTEAGEAVNARRIEISETDVRIEDIITRSAEDMQMNLVELFGEYEHDESRDWDEVETDINQLRTKIERLGNVNLDAISEQEDLEKRRDFLAEQLSDIDSARKRLDDLITRINQESRELFLATFNSVRENFQQLFRKLFGGGKADIMLLDDEDVLECGIEIMAKPPGKELRSLSLLSGGEKTMTALSLLFSIFKCRPSPFCLLDEVDAALDEANTERFSRLVQEFVSTSQFIVISHAKRTMSMSNVLYGVTMQEPGVSTRISVKFEDTSNSLDEQLEPVLT